MTAFDDVRQKPGCSCISDTRFDKRRQRPLLNCNCICAGLIIQSIRRKEPEKLYKHLFGAAAVFRSHIEVKRKF